MRITKRNNCVLCNNYSILNKIKNVKYPFSYINNTGEYDMAYGFCENCFSIQIMDLIDPAILYNTNYILPCFNTYNWIQHNISFVQFIVSSIEPIQPLIEIGGSSFCIGKHLIDLYKDYTVFDFSIAFEKKENVKYIEGNCETYDFEKGSNLILSHVFEHIYEPKKFIYNCSKNGVKNIIISIPNMNDDKIFFVTSQHTFSYSDNDIEYIFSLYNYNCIKKTLFNNNSLDCLFFHFSLVTDLNIIPRNINNKHYLYSLELLNKKINIPKNTFISTGGMYSILIYNLIQNKENLIGIIDRNPILKDKKYGNTNLQIFPYEHLKKFDENTSIIIHSINKNDIINCINKFNEKINIILI